MSTAPARAFPSRELALQAFRGLYGIAGPVGGRPEKRREETIATVHALLHAGVRVVQLRDKDSDGKALLAVAREVRELTSVVGALFIVNDRLDIAIMSEADGVHIGQDDLPVADVRRVASQCGRPDLIVGLSTHDLDQVRSARESDADYLGFGPVFATSTKADALPPRGPALLAEAVRLVTPLPVVAIGGIALANVEQVTTAGAAMAAVIGDIVQAPEPGIRAAMIHEALMRR